MSSPTSTSSNRVLVTGASGFIGRHCLPLLHDAGFEIHALTHRGLDLPTGPWTWHQRDLLADADLNGLLQQVRPTHLMHLAWLTTPGQFWHSSDNDLWIDASLKLVDDAMAAGARRIVVAGSIAEYDWSSPTPFGPHTPLQPDKRYGIAKNAARQQMEAMVSRQGASMAWARIGYLYGPYEHLERLVPQVILALQAGTPVETTDGLQRRDYLHVADVASALVTLLVSRLTGPVDVGSGEATAVRTLVTALGELIGRPDLIRLGVRPRAPDDPAILVTEPSALQQAGLWRPTFGLQEGLANTLAWWQARL